ncbi:MAG: radical SAM protein [Eubacterium sp.]|nr:radical SAM protein [Eubacterium sp.]
MEEWERIAEEFCCSETMRHELKQCLLYAKTAGINTERILHEMHQNGTLPCPDKKAGKVRLNQFKNALTDADETCGVTREKRAATLDTGLIYVEESIREHARTKEILARFPEAKIEPIAHYKDVYYSAPDKGNNSKKTHLILAEKRDERILPGAPVCQDFDERYFYYTSSAMGCLYDCEYCYLKGMHPSRDLLIYVNIEDTFREVESLLAQHEVYLCLSYDTDLMTIEEITGYVSLWSDFVRTHEGLLAECRTKCARTDLWERLTPCDRMIYAYTISPDEVIEAYEHRTPTLRQRLVCIREAMDRGFTVRLCFDPILRIPGWREVYTGMLALVREEIDLKKVRDISVGTFRISQDYLKRIRAAEPDSAAVQYPFVNEAGVYGYTAAQRAEMMQTVTGLLREAAPESTIVTMP